MVSEPELQEYNTRIKKGKRSSPEKKRKRQRRVQRLAENKARKMKSMSSIYLSPEDHQARFMSFSLRMQKVKSYRSQQLNFPKTYCCTICHALIPMHTICILEDAGSKEMRLGGGVSPRSLGSNLLPVLGGTMPEDKIVR